MKKERKVRNNLLLSSSSSIAVLITAMAIYANDVIASTVKIVLVTEHLPPYQIVNKNNQVSGFAVELIKETMKRSHYSYTLTPYSWVRSYNLTLQKANHCLFSVARLPIREALFKWIGKITEVNNAVFWGLKSAKNIEINDISDAKNYLTAVNRNDVTHLGLLERGFIEDEHLYVLENTKSLINLLVTRPEIDFIVADDITIGYRAELAGIDIKLIKRVLEIKDLPLNFYLACNINTDESIINNLKKSLKSIHADGFYQQLLEQWRDKMVHIK